MSMISEKIKGLREQIGISQAQLAKRLDVTRSSVNAWEMGLSTPTTQYVADMAKIFHISTDYLLGLQEEPSISLRGYTKEEIALIMNLPNYIDSNH